MSKLQTVEMTQQEMFERSFLRPSNYFTLSLREQWEIDEQLGILDWFGEDLTDEQIQRYREHYHST